MTANIPVPCNCRFLVAILILQVQGTNTVARYTYIITHIILRIMLPIKLL